MKPRLLLYYASFALAGCLLVLALYFSASSRQFIESVGGCGDESSHRTVFGSLILRQLNDHPRPTPFGKESLCASEIHTVSVIPADLYALAILAGGVAYLTRPKPA